MCGGTRYTAHWTTAVKPSPSHDKQKIDAHGGGCEHVSVAQLPVEAQEQLVVGALVRDHRRLGPSGLAKKKKEKKNRSEHEREYEQKPTPAKAEETRQTQCKTQQQQQTRPTQNGANACKRREKITNAIHMIDKKHIYTCNTSPHTVV